MNKFYIGSCKYLPARLIQHMNKRYAACYTTKAEDWELYYFDEELSYNQARLIEQHIKRMKSRRYIHNLSRDPEIMRKLKITYPA